MAGFLIILSGTVPGVTKVPDITIVFNGTLEDAQQEGERLRLESTPNVKVRIKGPRGGVYRLVPRDRNTGPGRWHWVRD